MTYRLWSRLAHVHSARAARVVGCSGNHRAAPPHQTRPDHLSGSAAWTTALGQERSMQCSA
eukprot:5776536-Alexandrium_andersonii.AAC.1